MQFEMSIQAEDLAGYVPAFGWEMAPPSDSQKRELEKRGILPDEIDNAGRQARSWTVSIRGRKKAHNPETDPVPGKIRVPPCGYLEL